MTSSFDPSYYPQALRQYDQVLMMHGSDNNKIKVVMEGDVQQRRQGFNEYQIEKEVTTTFGIAKIQQQQQQQNQVQRPAQITTNQTLSNEKGSPFLLAVKQSKSTRVGVIVPNEQIEENKQNNIVQSRVPSDLALTSSYSSVMSVYQNQQQTFNHINKQAIQGFNNQNSSKKMDADMITQAKMQHAQFVQQFKVLSSATNASNGAAGNLTGVNGQSKNLSKPSGSNSRLLVQKSNSQRSINMEGTPQSNLTNKSFLKNKHNGDSAGLKADQAINKTATKTQREVGNGTPLLHSSNLGSDSLSQHSKFSGQGNAKIGEASMSIVGQVGALVLSSNKKGLMPSGSSGTLSKKQILELEEVHSSSSSSIGKEENANQAFNNSNTGGGGQRKLFTDQTPLKTKLNFTGKPFAPDHIFLMNSSSIDFNTGDLEESMMIDSYSIKIPTSKLNEVRVSGQFNKLQNAGEKSKNGREHDETKTFSQSVEKQIKEYEGANNTVVKQQTQIQPSPLIIKNKIIKKGPQPTQHQALLELNQPGRRSLGSNNLLSSESTLSAALISQPSLKIKVLKTTALTSNKVTNHHSKSTNVPTSQPIKIKPRQLNHQEKPQLSPRVAQKQGEQEAAENEMSFIRKFNQQVMQGSQSVKNT